MQQKIRFLNTVLTIVMAILLFITMGLKSFLPTKVSIGLLIAIGIIFVIMIVAMLVSFLFSSNWMSRLVMLPVGYSVCFAGYMFYNMGVHKMLLNSYGIETEAVDSERIFYIMRNIFPKAMGGIWIAAAPLFIYVLVKYFAMTKNTVKNLDSFIPTTGRILDLQPTTMLVQGRRAYEITLEYMTSQGENITQTKSSVVPEHLLHLVVVGQQVGVLMDPKNNKNIVITTSAGNIL